MISTTNGKEKISKSQKRKLRKMKKDSTGSGGKNLTWSTEYDDKMGKRFRSTPFPNEKKIKDSYASTSTVLSFDSSGDDDDEHDDSHGPDKKRRRTNECWIVTETDNIKPDTSTDQNWEEKDLLLSPESCSLDSTFDEDQPNSDSSESEVFDSNRSLARQILAKINSEILLQNSSESSNNTEFSDVTDTSFSDFLQYSSDELSDNSDSELATDDLSDLTDESEYEPVLNRHLEDVKSHPKKTRTVIEQLETDSETEDSSDELFLFTGKTNHTFESRENKFKPKSVSKNTTNALDSFKFVLPDKKVTKVTTNKNVESQENKTVSEYTSNKQNSENQIEIDESSSSESQSSEIESESPDFYDPNQIESGIRSRTKISQIIPGVKISYAKNAIQFQITSDYSILLLKHPTKLYFQGKLSLKVLSGSVEILGYVENFENSTELNIYSPRGNCSLCIETKPYKTNPNIKALLKQHLIPDTQIDKFFFNSQPTDCIIAVKNIKNNMISYLNKHVAQTLFPKLQYPDTPAEGKIGNLEKKLQCRFEVNQNEWKFYKNNPAWSGIVDQLLKLKESRTFLTGGKGVGKSVLLRYMINKLLNNVEEVVCIDLDPGQAEFTLPGCVSVTVINEPILGPNYTHLKTPNWSFFVGDVNIAQCLETYIKSVKNLIKYCDANIRHDVPWIINYMGFTKSFGTDLITSIIKLISPTTVVQIQSRKENKNYSISLDKKTIEKYKSSVFIETGNQRVNYQLIKIESVAEENSAGEWEYEPRQIREMSVLSYFSQILKDKTEITAVQPYVVKLSSILISHVNYTKDNMPAALNGMLVALCQKTSSEIDYSEMRCIGFGIVRGIDIQNDNLYLITPVDETDLEMVNCLVKGNTSVPPSVYMTPGHDGLVPYISVGVPQGTSQIPKRNYRFIKSLLKRK